MWVWNYWPGIKLLQLIQLIVTSLWMQPTLLIEWTALKPLAQAVEPYKLHKGKSTTTYEGPNSVIPSCTNLG